MASERLEFEISGSAAELQRALNDVFVNGKKGAKELAQELGQPIKKTVQIDIKTDASGIARINVLEKERLGVLDKIASAVNKVQKIEAGSLTSLRQQVNQAKQVRDGIAKYKQTADALGATIKSINPLWEAQANKVARLSRELDIAGASTFWQKVKTGLRAEGFVSFINGLTQITQGFQSASIIIGQLTGSINSLIKTKADLQAFALSFRAIGIGAGGAAASLKEVERIAVNLGTRIQTVQDGFLQLTPVVLNSGGTLNDVSEIVEALSSRFAAFDIAGDRARRIMNGIIQAFAKGKLQAEELTQQISEAEPAFKTDFAEAVGVSVAELENLVKQGKITTDVLIETLPKLSKAGLVYGKLGESALDAAAALEKGNATVDQVRDNISNFNQLNLRKLATGLEPAIVAFLKLQATVTDFLADITKLGAIDIASTFTSGLLSAIQKVVASFLALAKAGLTVIEPITRLLNAFLSLPGAAESVGLAIAGKAVVALATLKKSLISATGATSGLGKALQSGLNWRPFLAGLGQFVTGSSNAEKQLSRTGLRFSLLTQRADTLRTGISNLTGNISTLQSELSRLQQARGILGSGIVEKRIEAIKGKISELSLELNKNQSALDRTEFRIDQTGQRLQALGRITGESSSIFTKLRNTATAFGKGVQGAFTQVGAAGKTLFAALGPIGTALAGIAIIQAAYNNATKETNSILDASKSRIELANKTILDLGGTSEQTSKSITGLALVWERFSLVVASAGDTLRRFGDTIFGGLSKEAKALQSPLERLIDTLGRFSAAAGLGAVAGAALAGALAGAAAGPKGAVIGAIVGVLTALIAGSNDADVRLQKLIRTTRAISEVTAEGANSISDLTFAVVKSSEATDVNREKLAALEKQRKDLEAQGIGTEGITEQLNELDSQIANLKNEIRIDTRKTEEGLLQAGRAIKELDGLVKTLETRRITIGDQAAQEKQKLAPLAPAIAKLAELQKEYEKAKQAAFGKNTYGPEGNRLRAVALDLQKTRGELEALARAKGIDPASIDSYRELQTELALLDKAIGKNKALLDGARTSYQGAAAAVGALTEEQKKTIPTIDSLNEQLNTLRQSLRENYNPQVTPDRWRELSAEIAETVVQLSALEDSAAGFEAVFTAAFIKAGVESKNLADSIENAGRRAQALEKAVVLVDIDAPLLPVILEQLAEANQKIDELNGKRAEITIAVIEEGLTSGTLKPTLGNIGRLVEQYNQLRISIPIDSPGIDQVITKIQELQRIEQFGALSNEELRKGIAQKQREDIEGAQALQQQASQFATQGIRSEESAVIKRYETEKSKISESLAAFQKGSAARLAAIAREGQEIAKQAAASSKAFAGLIANLGKPTPSEAALRKREIEELKRTAIAGSTEEERLRAKAQLERFDRENKIASLQEQAAQQAEQFARRQAALEEKRQQEEERAKAKAEEAAEKQKKIDEEIAKIQERRSAQQLEASEKSNSLQLAQYNLAVKDYAERKTQNAEDIEAMRELLAAREKAYDSGDLEEVRAINQDLLNLAGGQSKEAENYRDRLRESIPALDEGISKTDQIATNMRAAADQAARLGSEIRSLDGLVITVRVNSTPCCWTGGPVSAGTVYQVNELGQEGFLSPSGAMKPINKPKNGMWRAPSSGTVIPAHIWSQLNAPSGGVQVTRQVAATVSSEGIGGRMLRLLKAAIVPQRETGQHVAELARVQAHQSLQIGKLSHAVDKLANKDWNVNVGVRTSSGSTYLDGLNRKL